MTLRIGHVRLRLPPGYAGRAAGVAHGMARALARVPAGESRTIDALALGPIRVVAGASDGEVAAAVARQLTEQLKAGA